MLTACAASPPPALPAQVKALSTAPITRQPGKPRLFFVGLAMQSEQWSENDVDETRSALMRAAKGFVTVGPVFSDRFPPGGVEYGKVVAQQVEPAIASVREASQPGDVALIYVSTHGAPGLLGRQLEGQDVEPVGVAELKRWLEPLGGHDTILILSACFSGSFIPALAEPHRIIITAARADRPSFGCQAGAEHTIFGEAFLDAIAPETSLHTIVDRTWRAVTAAERQLGVPAPSLPQVSVGSAVKQLYDAPIF